MQQRQRTASVDLQSTQFSTFMLSVSYHSRVLKFSAVNKAFHCRNACFLLTGITKGIQNMGQKKNKRITAAITVKASICDRGCVNASTAQCGQRIICGARPRNPTLVGGAPCAGTTPTYGGLPPAAGTDEAFGSTIVA
jgi:hypothetical protein